MKVTTETHTIYTLKATKEEVHYLSALLQNYTGAGQEPLKEKSLRQQIWEALNPTQEDRPARVVR